MGGALGIAGRRRSALARCSRILRAAAGKLAENITEATSAAAASEIEREFYLRRCLVPGNAHVCHDKPPSKITGRGTRTPYGVDKRKDADLGTAILCVWLFRGG
jgi:hypothetical protein